MNEPILLKTLVTALKFAAYVALGLAILKAQTVPWSRRMIAFAVLNITAVFLFFRGAENIAGFFVVLGCAIGHWFLLDLFARSGNQNQRLYWVSFLAPIFLLAAFKSQSLLQIVGVSYMSFRMAQTAFEMSSDQSLKPGFFEYLAFLFFPPTASAGPINPFSYFHETNDGSHVTSHNLNWGAMRAAIGYIKLGFLATLAQQLTFGQHWEDGFQFGWADFLVSSTAYYLYLYLNFSGYSDMAIGASAIMGLKVRENFDNPLAARNIMEFWRRWHMSLTEFVRDALFTPITMTVMRGLGPRFADLAIVIATIATFTVFAFWHGVAAGFFIFYGLHAAAFIVNYFFDKFLRSRGKGVRTAYLSNPFIKACSQVATFLFVAITCGFLELTTWEKISSTIAAL
jgi:D-alanyl-lipoteichoic acid acyltransferase DltB (MBOAT superfamily)